MFNQPQNFKEQLMLFIPQDGSEYKYKTNVNYT